MMDGLMNELMNEWMDQWIDGWTESNAINTIYNYTACFSTGPGLVIGLVYSG